MKSKNSRPIGLMIALLVFAALALAGCSGSTGSAGPAGPAGPAGVTNGTVTGTVLAADGVTPMTGATISTSATGPVLATTGADGKFSASLPVGTYTLYVKKTGYADGTITGVNVAAAGSASSVPAVAMSVAASGLPTVAISTDKNEVGYGNTVNLTANVTGGANPPYTYTWAITSPSAGSAQGTGTIAPNATDPTKAVVTMPAMNNTSTFKGTFDGTVAKITVGGTSYYYQTQPWDQDNYSLNNLPATDLKGTASPANTLIPADGNYVTKFVPQTFTGNPQVLPIMPDTRGAVTVKLTVKDSLGGTVNVGMPSSQPLYAAAVQPGVKNVPVGVPVYINSGHVTPWAWTLTTKPTASNAALSSATAQFPSFVPDVAGKYTVTENGKSSDIYAGTFAGVITGGSYATKTFNLNNPEDASEAGMWYDTAATAYWPAGATSTTYTNWPVVTPDTACTACHLNNVVVNSLTAPDKFTPWAGTAHATFFARGIEGITGNSGSCLTCHTVGYDLSLAALNGGMDELMAANAWTYPTTRKSGNWAAMFGSAGSAAVAKLSNIQCENCHGPQNTGGHISGVKQGTGTAAAPFTRVSYSAEVCGVCHASGTGHHIYSEWMTMSQPDSPNPGKGHSNLALAQSRLQCGCHSAQAFKNFVSTLQSGSVEYDISISNPAAYTWTKADAQPQTCTACHDPHDNSNPNQLRVYDHSPTVTATGLNAVLPSGYSVSGLGKGAVCVTCHNMRGGQQCNGTVNNNVTPEPIAGIPAGGTTPMNATSATLNTINACIAVANGAPQRSQTLTFLHEDNDPYQIANPTYSGVHDATQADVLMGRNAFFMGNSLPMISKHAAVKDSCVGCHMILNPVTHLSHGAPATSTHNFAIADSTQDKLCANCHSSSVGAEGLQENVEASQAALVKEIGNYMMARMNAAIAAGRTLAYRTGSGTAAAPYVYTAFTTVGKAGPALTSAGLINEESANITIYKADGTTVQGNVTATSPYPSQSGTSVFILNAAGTGYTYFFSMDASNLNNVAPANVGNKVYKAQQNFLLITRDYSKGIHNPSFVIQVQNNTIAQMKDTTK